MLIRVFALVMFLLISLSIISLYQAREQQATSEWVHKSFEKILKIEESVSMLRDAQARHRAFLLTKDSIFTKEYDSLKVQHKKISAELNSLFSENPASRQLTQEINKLAQKRYENMDLSINLSLTHTIEELSHLLMNGYGVMDSLRTKVRLLESMEDQALKNQIEEKEKGDERVLFWILLLSISSLLVVLVSFLSLKTEIYKRTKAETDSQTLDRMVNERTSEILNINRKLKEKNLELKRTNEELNAFNFITNHDMQEPLRKIETFITFIKDNEPKGISSKVKPYFEKIVFSARRMRELIDAISIYSTYSRNQEFVRVDLNAVAASSLEKADKLIKEKKAKIEISDLPVITANLRQMEALFINLIGNGLKFSKEGSPPYIKITAKKTLHDKNNNVWRIDFSDNGIGFDEKYNDRIFTLFQRLHDRDKYSGTGIGLPICKKVAENHNGAISATSSPGNGTTISVFLPERQRRSQ